jgi:hypothetical protein
VPDESHRQGTSLALHAQFSSLKPKNETKFADGAKRKLSINGVEEVERISNEKSAFLQPLG